MASQLPPGHPSSHWSDRHWMDLLPLSTCRFQRMAGLGIASKTHRGFAGVLDVLVVATFPPNQKKAPGEVKHLQTEDCCFSGLKHGVNFTPYLGRWSNLTNIFFRWVGTQPPTIVDVLVNIDTSLGDFLFGCLDGLLRLRDPKTCFSDSLCFVFFKLYAFSGLVLSDTYLGWAGFLPVDGSETRRSPVEVACLSMFIPVFSKFYTSKRWFSCAGFLNHQQYQVPFLPLKHTKMLPMQTCKPLWRLVEAGDFVEFPTKKLHHRGTSRFFPPATPVESKPTSEKDHRNSHDFLGPLEVNHHANPYGVPQKPLPEVGNKKYKKPGSFSQRVSFTPEKWMGKEGTLIRLPFFR